VIILVVVLLSFSGCQFGVIELYASSAVGCMVNGITAYHVWDSGPGLSGSEIFILELILILVIMQFCTNVFFLQF